MLALAASTNQIIDAPKNEIADTRIMLSKDSQQKYYTDVQLF